MKILLIALFFVVLGGIFWVVITSAIKRQNWLDAHCKVIGETTGSYVLGGKGGYISGKTGYQCDDGIQYWE